MKSSLEETLLVPHLVTKIAFPSDNSLGSDSEQLKFEEAFKKLSCISPQLQISYKLTLFCWGFFYETCNLRIASLSQETLWTKFWLYLISHLTTLPICKMSCFLCFHETTNMTKLLCKDFAFEEGEKRPKKNSCWRAPTPTRVRTDHLLSNHRGSGHPGTPCTLSCHGQNPQITAKK